MIPKTSCENFNQTSGNLAQSVPIYFVFGQYSYHLHKYILPIPPLADSTCQFAFSCPHFVTTESPTN